MSADQSIEKAKVLMKRAIDLDRDGRHEDAADVYMDGAQALLTASGLMAEGDARREAIRAKAQDCLDRAEKLKPRRSLKVIEAKQRRIVAGSTGHGYDRIFGDYLNDRLTKVEVFDAYISAHHQIINFLRFCELVVLRAPSCKTISLTTGAAEKSQGAEGLAGIRESLAKYKVKLEVNYSATIHDREIRFDNGWIVKIGRGLDYFQRLDRYSIGFHEQNLRPCHETTIDVLRLDLNG
ncbi:unnamed protein product, partial [Mesorhabditis spiculigera]